MDDYSSYNASQDGLLAFCYVCAGLAVLVFFVFLGYVCWWGKCEIRIQDCGKNMAEVMRKYSTMQPKDVDSSTISSFHKELRDCFDSDDAYSHYISDWANNKQLEISQVDQMLLSYYQMNKNLYEKDTDKEDF